MDQQTYIDMPDLLAAVKLEELVHGKSLCKDIAMLSGTYQTFTVEAFHSLVIQFAPNMFVYSYNGMLCSLVFPSILVYNFFPELVFEPIWVG